MNQPYDYFYEFASEALHIFNFENFVKSMMPSLLELKVTPSFCFAFKIPDDVTATNKYSLTPSLFQLSPKLSNILSPLYCTIIMTRSSYDHIMSTARQLI